MSVGIAWLAPLAALIGLGVAAFLGTWVLKQDPGNEKMQEISKATQEGAMAFLKAEWRVLIIFAIGVFVAFTPTFGLHTVTCLLLAWIFRVSKPVTLTATFVNNPWTIVPLYGFCLWFGTKITGSEIAVPPIDWHELTLSNVFHVLKPYLWPFVAGTLIAGVIASLAAYILFYWAATRYRKMQKS